MKTLFPSATPAAPVEAPQLSTFHTLREQQLQAAALPSIPSPPAPDRVAIGPQTSGFQTIYVPAAIGGAKVPIQIRGDFVYIQGITFDTSNIYGINRTWGSVFSRVSIRPDTLNVNYYITEPNWEIRFPVPFNSLEIENNVGVGVWISLWIGFGGARRDRGRFSSESTAGDNYIGPAFVLNAGYVMNNHTLPYVFTSAASPYNQRSILKAARLSFYKLPPVSIDFSLFLYSTPLIWAEAFNTPYAHIPVNNEDYIGKVDFKNAYLPPAGGMATVNVQDINLPVFTRPITSLGGVDYQFAVFGLLVSNAVLNMDGLNIWNIYLNFEFP